MVLDIYCQAEDTVFIGVVERGDNTVIIDGDLGL